MPPMIHRPNPTPGIAAQLDDMMNNQYKPNFANWQNMVENSGAQFSPVNSHVPNPQGYNLPSIPNRGLMGRLSGGGGGGGGGDSAQYDPAPSHLYNNPELASTIVGLIDPNRREDGIQTGAMSATPLGRVLQAMGHQHSFNGLGGNTLPPILQDAIFRRLNQNPNPPNPV